MKNKRRILTIVVITIVTIASILRLMANKSSFEDELKMVSESNTVIPIIADTVKYMTINTGFTENGSFSASKEISVCAETSGKITNLLTDVGDNVTTGAVLATTNNAVVKSQMELARYTVEKAEKDYQRYEQLTKGDAVTPQQYESAKQAYINAQASFATAREQYDNSFIKAPFDGTITKRLANQGTFLQPGIAVFEMVQVSTLKFTVKLTEEELQTIHIGQVATIRADAFPETDYQGKVTAIIAKADATKRFEVELEIHNPKGYPLKPGMFGTAFFEGTNSGNTLFIPRKAISGSIKNPEVFVVAGDSVTSRKIIVIPFNDRFVEVRQGLRLGELVVTSGQINLVEGSKIKLNK